MESLASCNKVSQGCSSTLGRAFCTRCTLIHVTHFTIAHSCTDEIDDNVYAGSFNQSDCAFKTIIPGLAFCRHIKIGLFYILLIYVLPKTKESYCVVKKYKNGQEPFKKRKFYVN